LFCETDQFQSFRDRGGERLIDDHVTAGFETLFREREMRLVRRGDYDQLDRVDGEQLFDAADDSRVWTGLGGGIAGTLQNRRQAEAVYGPDYRRVEASAG
jgi:hypothetical protein